MDLIQKIINHIIECRKDDDFKDDSDSKLIKIFFKQEKLNIPSHIQTLLCTDHLFFQKIIEHYEKKFIKYYTDGKPFEECLEKLSKKVLDNPDSDINKKYIDFDKEIFPWLIESNFFKNIPVPDIIVPIIPDFSWCRPNQKLSMIKSLENDFESAIDLHATGGGKTYLILAKAYYFNQIYNKNVILLCEKKYILSSEFLDFSNLPHGIIDISKINIINLTINPDKYFYDKIKGNNNLIIVNRSYISSKNRFQNINGKHNIGLVLIDECHSSSAYKTFEILNYFKSLTCNLIGFSATPVRGNKYSSYVQLYGSDNKINYICNYSLFNAILDYDPNMEKPYGCLPFKIYIYNNQDKTPQKLLEIINSYQEELHYKKIIVWFRKIDTCQDFFDYFQKNFTNKNIKLFISHNEGDTCETDKEYIKSESNCIMFCVNRFREGTNLNTLEFGFLLDSDINRGDISTIQMCGRLIRFDKQGKKTHGKIADFCSNSNILEKIIKYYIELTNDENNKFIDEIISKIEVIKDKKQINFNLGKNKKIELIFKSFEINWDNIKEELINYIQSNFKYNIYRVPIGESSKSNFIKTIKKLKEPVWGCRETLVKKIKVNDKLIFEVDNEIEFYSIKKIENNPDKGNELWNDPTYSKILYLEYMNSIEIYDRYKFLNKLIGYKEAYVPRTITLITHFTDDFTTWFQNIIINHESDSEVYYDVSSDSSEIVV